MRHAVKLVLLACVALYAMIVLALVALRWVDPVTTTVHMQRRVEAWIRWKPYDKHYRFVPLARISPNLQRAVVAAEDGRFWQHYGIDWKEVRNVIDEDLERGRVRGASTIDQQLAKNLFLTTHRNPLRKMAEFAILPALELLLPKTRILELYLNVVEWGPGVYGAEAAAQTYYRVPASRLSREQAARLAAILPSPLRRKPGRMHQYSAEILRRME